jgi:hypothetical protein
MHDLVIECDRCEEDRSADQGDFFHNPSSEGGSLGEDAARLSPFAPLRSFGEVTQARAKQIGNRSPSLVEASISILKRSVRCYSIIVMSQNSLIQFYSAGVCLRIAAQLSQLIMLGNCRQLGCTDLEASHVDQAEHRTK